MNTLPTIQPTDTRPLAAAMAILASLPERVSLDRVAAWKRQEQRLSDLIAELTAERDNYREKIRNVEQ